MHQNFLQWRIKNVKEDQKLIDINSNEPPLYPFGVLVNKCSGSCNNIPYAK